MSRADIGRSQAMELTSTRADRILSEAHRIAILIPCFNEAAAIATVVADFKAAVPAAQI